jgi:imidazolonepropionase-like amidohydrolase
MTTFRAGCVLCIGLSITIGLSIAGVKAAQDPAGRGVTALTGATVIGSTGASVQDAVVVIDGARIAQVGPRATTKVPPNAAVVDVRGKFIVPGLVDVHNHVRTGSLRRQQNTQMNLTALLAFGVTTVLNPASSAPVFAELKKASAAEGAPFPRVFGTGPMITAKGGALGDDDGGPTPENEADARAAVAGLKAAGVDAIKVSRDDATWATTRRAPLMALDVLRAVVDEAHRQGLKVFAHAPLLDFAKDALRAGVDGLLHGIIDRPVDQELLDLLVRTRAVYVPTMALYEDVADTAAWARRQSTFDERQVLLPIAAGFTSAVGAKQLQLILDNVAFTRDRLPLQRANAKRVFDAGIPVAMGTDTGFPGVLMGVASQVELALMAEAGLPREAVLRAATINGARMLGRDDLGSIESGKAADLLVLDANPLDDIGNIRRINRVIRGGVVHDPAQLLSAVRFTAPTVPFGK